MFFLIIAYIFYSTKLENKRVEQVLPRSRQREESKEVAQTMYTYVSKCKNNKRKRKMACRKTWIHAENSDPFLMVLKWPALWSFTMYFQKPCGSSDG
jgi:hypothetical protein